MKRSDYLYMIRLRYVSAGVVPIVTDTGRIV